MTFDPNDLDLVTNDHDPVTLAAMRTVSLMSRQVSNMTLTDINDFCCKCNSHADTTVTGHGALLITGYNQLV